MLRSPLLTLKRPPFHRVGCGPRKPLGLPRSRDGATRTDRSPRAWGRSPKDASKARCQITEWMAQKLWKHA